MHPKCLLLLKIRMIMRRFTRPGKQILSHFLHNKYSVTYLSLAPRTARQLAWFLIDQGKALTIKRKKTKAFPYLPVLLIFCDKNLLYSDNISNIYISLSFKINLHLVKSRSQRNFESTVLYLLILWSFFINFTISYTILKSSQGHGSDVGIGTVEFHCSNYAVNEPFIQG